MTKLLLKLFINNYSNSADPKVRVACGKLAGWAGIVCNLFLFSIKLLVGMLAKSIAVTADAFNNLSDASSNIISMIGFQVSERPADDEHPFGHARSEYISSLGVALVILFIALELLKSSVEKVVNPVEIDFGLPLFIALIVSVGVKAWMAAMNKNIAERIDSTVLRATSQDSINDVITTSTVLAGALISKFSGINLDGWLGIGVSVFIGISGFLIVKDTLSLLLGQGASKELVGEIEEKILGYDGVLNMHDLMVHDYGPGHRFASAHVEMDSSMPVLKSHDIIDNIERDLLRNMNIRLVIHYDPILIHDKETNETYDTLKKIIHEVSPQLSMHDFRMVKGEEHKNLIFDVVVPHKFSKTESEIKKLIDDKLKEINLMYYTIITFDYGESVKQQKKKRNK